MMCESATVFNWTFQVSGGRESVGRRDSFIPPTNAAAVDGVRIGKFPALLERNSLVVRDEQ